MTSKQLSVQKQRRCDTFIRPNVEDSHEKLKSINQILLNTRRNMNHQSLRVQNSGLEIVFDDCHEKLKRINQTLLAIQKNN